MVFKVDFEAVVHGISADKKVEEHILVSAKDGSAARHYAEGYIAVAYSADYAILGCIPLYVHGLE